MALVDPNIAMSFKGIQLPTPVNALAQASQLMQIKQAQAQMAEYERARQEEERVRSYLSGISDLSKSEARIPLIGMGKPGIEIFGKLTEADKAALEQRKVAGEIASRTEKVYQNMSGIINSKQDAIKFLSMMVNDPDLKDSPIAKIPLMDQVSRIPEDPAGLDEWKKKFAVGAVQWAEKNKPQYFDRGEKGVLAIPGMGGPATVVPGSPYTKPPSPSDIIAQQRLEFEKKKFAWEQQNPGYELKEDTDGNFYGVNKRTLQAFPVNIGAPGAPVAPAPANALAPQPAPPVNAMAQPPAAPGLITPAYSPSALPAAAGPSALPAVAAPPAAAPVPAPAAVAPVAPAAPAVVPRQLVGGKVKQDMTEAQSNSALFGGAMSQAQGIINELEQSGTAKNAIVPGILTGLASLVPLGVGENLGNVITSTFNSDPTGWAGPNEAQQRLAQAQLSFAMAWLRKTSGAAFGASEVTNTIKEYFPMIGDGEKVIKQKAAARKRAIEGLKISTNAAGRKYIESYETVGAAPSGAAPSAAPSGAAPSANDPLGIRKQTP